MMRINQDGSIDLHPDEAAAMRTMKAWVDEGMAPEEAVERIGNSDLYNLDFNFLSNMMEFWADGLMPEGEPG